MTAARILPAVSALDVGRPHRFFLHASTLLVVLVPSPDAQTIVAWGNNDYGQVSSIPAGADFTQVAAGNDHSVALRADGTIASWGKDWDGQVSNTPRGPGF